MNFIEIGTVIVRNLINDLGDIQTYEDDRIAQALVVAGLIVSQEFPFSTRYTFDFSTPLISPDPTAALTFDPIMLSLSSLKAACILTMNNYQSAVSGGGRVKDGDTEVDTTAGFKGYRDIIDIGPCAAYQKVLKIQRTFQSMSCGKAITGSMSHPDFMASSNYSMVWNTLGGLYSSGWGSNYY